MNFKDKLELQCLKLSHFFNQLGICIILYLLANYSIPKQSLKIFFLSFTFIIQKVMKEEGNRIQKVMQPGFFL